MNNNTTKTTTTVKRTVNRRKKTNKGKRKRNTTRSRLPILTNNIHVSDCAKLYLKALIDPFNVQGSPCIPDNIILPSHKYASQRTGSFTIGSDGIGWIVVDPYQMLFRDLLPLNNDTQGAIIHTAPGYTNSLINLTTIAGSLGDGITVDPPRSMFTVGQFDPDPPDNGFKRFRLVGCGLKAKYAGSTFNNQGTITQFRMPGNINIPNGYENNQMLTYNYARQDIVKGNKWTYVYYTPESPDDFQYSSIHGFTTNYGGDSHYCLALFVNGGNTTVEQSFMYEVKAHFEIIGDDIPLTKSHADPQATTAVLSAVPNRAPASTPQAEMPVVANGFLDSLGEMSGSIGSSISDSVIDLAKSELPGLLKSLVLV